MNDTQFHVTPSLTRLKALYIVWLCVKDIFTILYEINSSEAMRLLTVLIIVTLVN